MRTETIKPDTTAVGAAKLLKLHHPRRAAPDGDRLCELLKRYDLGVQTTIRTVEDVSIDAGFFGEI